MVVSYRILYASNLYSRMELRYRVPVSIINNFSELNGRSSVHFVADSQLIFMTILRF